MPNEAMEISPAPEPRTPPLDIRPISMSPPGAPQRQKLRIVRRSRIEPVPIDWSLATIVVTIPRTWPRATLILRRM